jgi:hypothetical protein
LRSVLLQWSNSRQRSMDDRKIPLASVKSLFPELGPSVNCTGYSPNTEESPESAMSPFRSYPFSAPNEYQHFMIPTEDDMEKEPTETSLSKYFFSIRPTFPTSGMRSTASPTPDEGNFQIDDCKLSPCAI